MRITTRTLATSLETVCPAALFHWMRCHRGGIALLLAVAIGACRAAPDTPETRIRGLVAKAESAAEDKDLRALKELISETYSGREGETKRDVVRVISFYLLRNESIHLLTQVRRIELPEPRRAEATLFVAMAGRRIDGIDQLSRLRADIYRVDLALADEGEGDWKVTRAEWRQADVTDLGGES
jgi:hypothetical protein